MTRNNLSWKIGGEAGFGIKSAGVMLGKIFMRSGYEIFDYTEYPSLIRGGHNTFQLMVDPNKANSVSQSVDILVALNQESIDGYLVELSHSGLVLYDQAKAKLSARQAAKYKIEGLALPLSDLAKDSGGGLMRNVVALGATLALVGQNLSIANGVIKENFKRKGSTVVNNNLKALKSGFDYIKKNYQGNFFCQLPKLPAKDNILISANESLALGALVGGLNFYVAYPMTPSSSILHYLASVAEKTGIVV